PRAAGGRPRGERSDGEGECARAQVRNLRIAEGRQTLARRHGRCAEPLRAPAATRSQRPPCQPGPRSARIEASQFLPSKCETGSASASTPSRQRAFTVTLSGSERGTRKGEMPQAGQKRFSEVPVWKR